MLYNFDKGAAFFCFTVGGDFIDKIVGILILGFFL